MRSFNLSSSTTTTLIHSGGSTTAKLRQTLAIAVGVFICGAVWFRAAAVCGVCGFRDRPSDVFFPTVCCCFSSFQQLLLCSFPPWCGCVLVFWCVPFWFGFKTVPAGLWN